MFEYAYVFGARLPVYGLCMAAGILLACAVSCVRARRRGRRMDSLLVIIASALCCGLVGAKLLYIAATYGAGRFAGELMRGDFSALTDDGLVFYGGLTGGLGGALLGARIAGERLSDFCDPIIPAVPLAHALGRVGCFCAGCCYGTERAALPVQLIEAALNLALSGALMLFTRRRRRGTDALFAYLAAYAVIRFGVEFLRGDAARGAALGVSTSQWIGLAMLAASGAYLAARRRVKNHDRLSK